MNNQYQWEKSLSGFDVKIRFWVKPNTMVSVYKRLICPAFGQESEEVKMRFPIKDIWTRVVLESEMKE